MKLVGKGTYKLTSNPSFLYAISELRTATVTILSEYYYDIMNETKLEIIDEFDNTIFIGVVDTLDFNFEDGIIKLYMTEYIGIIKYNTDMLGASEFVPYNKSFTSTSLLTIGNSI